MDAGREIWLLVWRSLGAGAGGDVIAFGFEVGVGVTGGTGVVCRESGCAYLY